MVMQIITSNECKNISNQEDSRTVETKTAVQSNELSNNNSELHCKYGLYGIYMEFNHL